MLLANFMNINGGYDMHYFTTKQKEFLFKTGFVIEDGDDLVITNIAGFDNEIVNTIGNNSELLNEIDISLLLMGIMYRHIDVVEVNGRWVIYPPKLIRNIERI